MVRGQVSEQSSEVGIVLSYRWCVGGLANKKGSGVGIVLISPQGEETKLVM